MDAQGTAMNEQTEIQPQQLTAIERSRVALKFDERKAELEALKSNSARIVAITNADGRQECHAALMLLLKTRTAIAAAGEMAREDAVQFSKAVISGAKELISIISPEEKRLQDLRNEWDSAREKERQAKLQAERARIAALEARVQAIRDMAGIGCMFMSGDELAARMHELDCMPLAGFDEFQEAASAAHVAAIEAVRKLLESARRKEAEAERIKAEREAEQARLDAERAELERLRAEQAAAQAERDRIAAEALAAERAKLAEEQAKAKAEREELDRQAAELRRIADEKAAAERAEQARIDEQARAAAQAKADAEAAIRREQEAVERAAQAERDRLIAEQQAEEAERLRAEAARLEAIDAEQRAALEARLAAERKAEIDNATLKEAATEALALLSKLYPNDITTLKLASALAKEVK